MEDDTYLLKFDFYGDNNYTSIGFSSVDINSVPIKLYFEKNRVGFSEANERISSPMMEIALTKKIHSKEIEKLVDDFFIHYLIYPDMPLEFNMAIDRINRLSVNGFIKEIKFSQNTVDPYYEMSIKLCCYS